MALQERLHLHHLFHQYLRGEIALTQLERGLVPSLPHVGHAAATDPLSELARQVDDLIEDVGVGEANEDDLRALLGQGGPGVWS
jgi:hypothetical protein